MRCIRTLTPAERPRYESHLLRLDADDRRLRFGFAIDDAGVRAHVAGIDLDRDRILVHVDDELRLVGAVHIARAAISSRTDAAAVEFAFSVDRGWRGRGLGGQLFEHAVAWARNRAVHRVHIYYLTDNHAMRTLARRAGMTICCEAGECEGFLELAPATPFSLLREVTAERWAIWENSAKRARQRRYALVPRSALLSLACSLADRRGGNRLQWAGSAATCAVHPTGDPVTIVIA